MGFLHQYWPWLVTVAIGAGIITVFLLRRAVSFSASVKKELEDYLIAPQALLPVSPPPPSDTAAVAEQKQLIWHGIRNHPAPTDQIQIGWLVQRLAEAQVDVRFRNLYFTIFGSQHRFLRELNQSGGPITRLQAENFLKLQGEQNERVRTKVFNEWIGAMVEAGLLSVGVDSFTLTPLGQDFLVWITRQRLPDRTYE